MVVDGGFFERWAKTRMSEYLVLSSGTTVAALGLPHNSEKLTAFALSNTNAESVDC